MFSSNGSFSRNGSAAGRVVSTALALMLASAGVALAAAPRRGALPGSRAHAAHVLSGTDIAHMHLVRQHETHLFEEGDATGVMPGRMKAELTVGPVFRGTFTIYGKGGSITGHGTAKPHGTGRYQSFGGTLYVSGGSGRYRHVRGRTGLYGTFDRRTFDVVVKTQGRLSY